MSYKIFRSVCAISVVSAVCAHANPEGMSIVSGEVTAVESANHLHIKASDKSVINWNHFSIGKGESAYFEQPSQTATVVNKVSGSTLSEIYGSLKANGHLYLINPNGVIFGEGCEVDTGSLTALALETVDLENLNGGTCTGVINLGKVIARQGDIILLGQRIVNEGELIAENGRVGMGAGMQIVLKPRGASERIHIVPQQGVDEVAQIGVDHSGMIRSVENEVKADGNLYKLAINMKGMVDALGVENRSGRILLHAEDGRVEIDGEVRVQNIDDTGGVAHLLGEEIVLRDGALIDASGSYGGGEVLIGGDYAGQNPDVPNSRGVWTQSGAIVRANATVEGDGGRIIFWGDEGNVFYGSAFADAGAQGGDGGFIEVSSPGCYVMNGKTSARSPRGKPGQVLFDPPDVVISSAMSSGFIATPVIPAKFDFTAATAVVNAADLDAALMGGTSVIINTACVTGGPFSGSGKITLDASAVAPGVNWFGSTATLSLITTGDVEIQEGSGGFSTDSGKVIIQSGGNVKILDNIFASEVTITSSSLEIGDGSQGAPISVGTAGPGVAVTFNTGDLKVVSAAGFDALVSAGSTTLNISATDITVDACAGGGGQGAVIEGGADTRIFASNDITLVGESAANRSVIKKSADPTTTFDVRAGRTIDMQAFSTISNEAAPAGDVGTTVVVDACGATSPMFGPGKLIMADTAIIQGGTFTAQPIRIFAASASQLMIDPAAQFIAGGFPTATANFPALTLVAATNPPAVGMATPTGSTPGTIYLKEGGMSAGLTAAILAANTTGADTNSGFVNGMGTGSSNANPASGQSSPNDLPGSRARDSGTNPVSSTGDDPNLPPETGAGCPA